MELFIEYRVSMGFLVAFLLLFLPLRHGRALSFLIAAACYLVTTVIDAFVAFDVALAAYSWVSLVVEIVIVQGTAFLLSQYRDFRTLFTGISAAAYVLPGNMACELLFGYSQNLPLAIGVQTGIHIGIILYFTLTVRKSYLEDMTQPGIGWALLCLIPALFYAMVFSLNSMPGHTPETLLAPMSILTALLVVAYTAVIKIFSRNRKMRELQRDNDLLESYTERVRREVRDYQEVERKNAVIRHDQRHYATMIAGYLDAGEYEKIRELLMEANDRIDRSTPLRFCANASVNAVLAVYWGACEKEGVVFSIEASVPAEIEAFDEFEFGTVVANLLDNALDAVEAIPEPEKRKIHLRIYRVKEQGVLEVSNSFRKRPVLDQETGMPVSSRGEEHGVGSRSVCSFVDRVGAWIDYSIEGDLFFVRIVMPMEY